MEAAHDYGDGGKSRGEMFKEAGEDRSFHEWSIFAADA
jgi:hypothetical protein